MPPFVSAMLVDMRLVKMSLNCHQKMITIFEISLRVFSALGVQPEALSACRGPRGAPVVLLGVHGTVAAHALDHVWAWFAGCGARERLTLWRARQDSEACRAFLCHHIDQLRRSAGIPYMRGAAQMSRRQTYIIFSCHDIQDA
jgi:hypothetical protein